MPILHRDCLETDQPELVTVTAARLSSIENWTQIQVISVQNTSKRVLLALLAATFQFVAQSAWTEPLSNEPFQLSADWQHGGHGRKARERRSGDDRDRVNERDVGARARELESDLANSDDRPEEKSGGNIAYNIISGIACLDNPKCGSIWIPPGGR